MGVTLGGRRRGGEDPRGGDREKNARKKLRVQDQGDVTVAKKRGWVSKEEDQ